MLTFRSILVAADFSESSVQAFQWACSLAAENNTQITLLHVVEDMLVIGFPEDQPPADPARHAVMIQHLRAVYVPDRPLALDYCVREGLAPDEILRMAQTQHSDLIVMGTHGRRGISRLLAGSVAEAVLRRAECPVLAVRLAAGQQPRAAAQHQGVASCR